MAQEQIVDRGAEERIRCMRCAKSVSTPVPLGTTVRAWIECPECIAKEPLIEAIREYARHVASGQLTRATAVDLAGQPDRMTLDPQWRLRLADLEADLAQAFESMSGERLIP